MAENSELSRQRADLRDERVALAAPLARRKEELDEAHEVLAEANRRLAEAQRRQGSWARVAREIERSRTWRLGHLLIRALRMFTLRRPVSSHGPGELVAAIEAGEDPRDAGKPL